MEIERQARHSASVAAYISVGRQQLPVAKINGDYLTLAEACALAPGTEAQLHIIIDGKKSTRLISLDDGVACGQRQVRYSVLAPF